MSRRTKLLDQKLLLQKLIVIKSYLTQSTSSSSSSDLDNVPLGKLYPFTQKGFSSSTKTHKKPADNITHEPVRFDIDERIIGMSQRKSDFYNRFPANNPLKPPMIQPLNVVPADAEFIDEHIGSESSNPNASSSSQPSSTNQNLGISVLDNLVSHYSGELPEVKPTSQKASEVVSMEIASESPQHQAPNQQMTTSTSPEHVPTPEHIAPEHIVPEQLASDHIISPSILETVSESDFMITSYAPDVEIEQSSSTMIEKSIPNQPSINNTQTPNSINSQS
jgi:hypothetical protein